MKRKFSLNSVGQQLYQYQQNSVGQQLYQYQQNKQS
jgi:hypothetical protein